MIKQIIKKSPKFIQNSVKGIYGAIPLEYRLGKTFTETYNLLKATQYWTKEQHEEYQIKQLKQLLNHSYNNVPYYHNLFNEAGFNPDKFKYLDEMAKIPFLTKDIVMNNIEDLKAKNFSEKNFEYSSTGGTTGKQMRFYLQKGFSKAREWAFVSTQWNRMGYDYNKSKRIILRNQVLKEGTLWEWDRVHNSLVIDTYHLTDENIKKIIDKINKEKIEFIHTYPSAITIICDFINKTGYGLTYKLKAVLATSENIYNRQREHIESTLKTRLFSFYGHSELCIFAGECEKSTKYHIFSEYGYTELVDSNDKVISEDGVIGELVGTSFNNFAMPFIRYRTADYSSYSQEQECECERNYKLLNSVEGRWLQEMIITSQGNKISITAMNMHSNIFDNVKAFQFYQDTPGICIIKLVRKDSFTLYDEKNIYAELKKKLGAYIDLKVEYVNEIPRTIGGKYRFVVQKLKIDN